MISGLLLLLSLLRALSTIRAADVDVILDESVVPQCTTLKASWSQAHLHVQPGDSITLTNLVDLDVLDTSSTTFQVFLAISADDARRSGQNFTFAFNTLTDQFTVFQSNLMQVGPGSTDCLAGQVPVNSPSTSSTSRNIPTAPPATAAKTTSTTSTPNLAVSRASSNPAPARSSIASSASTAGSTATTAVTGTSSPYTPASPPASVASASASSLATSSSKSTFTISTIIGSVCALAALVLLGFGLFWNSHRRSMQLLAALRDGTEPKRVAPRESAPHSLVPLVSRAYQENPPPATISSPMPKAQTALREATSRVELIREEGPPAYED
ncbi:hypothetical protein FB451DRAFT_1189265 [Mycena latifolia]|nr:hypothetical protein FB451DRAFT_1189265 [Mycena latifolia]